MCTSKLTHNQHLYYCKTRAEREGFEPPVPEGTLHFECSAAFNRTGETTLRTGKVLSVVKDFQQLINRSKYSMKVHKIPFPIYSPYTPHYLHRKRQYLLVWAHIFRRTCKKKKPRRFNRTLKNKDSRVVTAVGIEPTTN